MTAALTALGIDYRLARIAGAACEAVYMYTALRWVIFRDTRGSPPPVEPL